MQTLFWQWFLQHRLPEKSSWLLPGQHQFQQLFHIVRMLDNDGGAQQEALGVVGVNLIHAVFNYFTQPKKIIESLVDDLEPCRYRCCIRKKGGVFCTG
jgi:hypothetical protein